MKNKQAKRPSPGRIRVRTSLTVIAMVVIVAILTSLYLGFAWNRYQQMAKSEATQLAQSVGALLHVEHIEALTLDDEVPDGCLVEQALTRLVEVTDSIYYAYILKQQNGTIAVIVDSAAADSGTSRPTKRSCEETAAINRLPFDTGESIVTDPVSAPCGDWVRALVPIYDLSGKSIIAALGLSYSSAEWQAGLWKKMIPDSMVVACLAALAFTLFNLLRKNARFKEAEASRQESERSKSVLLAHLPGMAYRCKNDRERTMEFVSEGCVKLTGYNAEDLISNKEISYLNIIAPGYRKRSKAKWDCALSLHQQYHDEYEIITKSGGHKWVLEMGQGVYDESGSVVALEGIVLDISKQKKGEREVSYLREHDLLTGLYNLSHMEQEKKRLDQPGFLPLSLAICDIDGLRMINDAFGHEEGDKLIQKTAGLIQGCLHSGQVLGYAGSGKFMILLPQTDSKAAHRVKADIKHAVERYNSANKHGPYAINVSIGHSTKDIAEQSMQSVGRDAEEYLTRRKLLNQNSSHSSIVSSIMATLYAKSQETEEHGHRLCGFCQMIGERLGLSQRELDDLQLLSKLHDIGKIGVDDRILNKPDKLNEDEWAIMKQHPEIGHRIAMSTPQLEHIAEYILYHHERWDGTGYPMGLKGREIPVVARVLAIADAYDAMTEDRIYRKAMSKETAIKEMVGNAGTQFDPDIANLFVKIIC